MEIIMEKALKIIMLERGLETIMVILNKEIFRLFMSIKAKNVLQLVFMIPITRLIMKRITATTDYSHDLNLNVLMIVRS